MEGPSSRARTTLKSISTPQSPLARATGLATGQAPAVSVEPFGDVAAGACAGGLHPFDAGVKDFEAAILLPVACALWLRSKRRKGVRGVHFACPFPDTRVFGRKPDKAARPRAKATREALAFALPRGGWPVCPCDPLQLGRPSAPSRRVRCGDLRAQSTVTQHNRSFAIAWRPRQGEEKHDRDNKNYDEPWAGMQVSLFRGFSPPNGPCAFERDFEGGWRGG